MPSHDGANRGAGREEKISDVNAVFERVLCDGIAILVGECEIGDGVVFFDKLNGGVDHLWVDIMRLINLERFLRRERMVNGSNNDHRQQGHHQGKTFVFGQKRTHLICFATKVIPVWAIIQPLALKVY